MGPTGGDGDGDAGTERCVAGGESAKVLQLCADLAAAGNPLYISSDETDPAVTARWSSRGCLAWARGPLSIRPIIRSPTQ